MRRLLTIVLPTTIVLAAAWLLVSYRLSFPSFAVYLGAISIGLIFGEFARH